MTGWLDSSLAHTTPTNIYTSSGRHTGRQNTPGKQWTGTENVINTGNWPTINLYCGDDNVSLLTTANDDVAQDDSDYHYETHSYCSVMGHGSQLDGHELYCNYISRSTEEEMVEWLLQGTIKGFIESYYGVVG